MAITFLLGCWLRRLADRLHPQAHRSAVQLGFDNFTQSCVREDLRLSVVLSMF